MQIILLGADNREIFHGRLIKLSIQEKQIIANSIEWFHDSEPCFIHRSAVMNRMFAAFEDYLQENFKQTGSCQCTWESLPEKFRMFELTEPVETIVYECKKAK